MSTFHRRRDNAFHHADALRHRDEVKRHLLKMSDQLQRRMEQLESEMLRSPVSSPPLRRNLLELLSDTLVLSEDLNVLTEDKYRSLYDNHERIETAVREHVNSISDPRRNTLSLPLARSGEAPGPEKLIGGKAANLERLASIVPDNVPPGFVITSDAYHTFMEENRIQTRIHSLLKDLDVIADKELYRNRTRAIRELIVNSPVPEAIEREIQTRAGEISEKEHGSWAVRSSCVGEDGRRSFAGQFDSLLNVPPADLGNAYRRVLASRFTDRAAYYRTACGFSEVDTPMAVLFMPMIPARSAGVLYTRDPRDGSADLMPVNSVWGLAADMLLGRAALDTFLASRSEPGRIEFQSVADKKAALSPADSGKLERIPLDAKKSSVASLSSEDLAGLVRLGLEVEKYFGTPRDVEWVIGPRGGVTIVQARRLLVKDHGERASGIPSLPEKLLLEGGKPLFPGWAAGPVYTPTNFRDISNTPSGAILVVAKTTPEIFPALVHLGGLILEEPDPAPLLAARVQGFAIPCLCSVDNAVTMLAGHDRVILDASQSKVFEAPERSDKKAEAPERGASVTGPLRDLVFSLGESGSPRSDQCRSLHDIIHLVHERALRFDIVSGKERD